MPGTRCTVAVCSNSLQKTKLCPDTVHIQYHKFPEDEELRRTWIQRCKRDGKWNPSVCRVCSVHFTEDDYERDLKSELLGLPPRKILKKTAIPSLHLTKNKVDARKLSTENRISFAAKRERKQIVNFLLNDMPNDDFGNTEIVSEPTSSHNDCKTSCSIDSDCYAKYADIEKQLNFEKFNVRVLQKKCAQLQTKLNLVTKKNKNLKTQLNSLKSSRNKQLAQKKALSCLKSVFTESQYKALISGKQRLHWDVETIQRALTLRYISKKSYMYIKKRLGYPLPSVPTLHRWAASIPVEKGFLGTVLSVMESASHKLGALERVTVIQFDEMKIKTCYEYDRKNDEIIGPYKQMQVIQARGLFSSWKQPVYIDFDTNMTKELLLSVITKLHDIGYIVVACVSDMSSCNRRLWNSLCSDVHSKPFFPHPNETDLRIYLFPDAPHLLKLLRNWLLDSGFILPDGTLVCKEIIQALVNLNNEEYKACHKLSLFHVTCEGSQRQNVRSAAQLFSHTTACAIRRYRPGGLNVQDADNIADFFDLINNWFDIMNSYTPFNQVKSKCAYGTDEDNQNKILDEAKFIVGTMKCRGKKTSQVFQKGFLMSMNAVQGLLCDLKAKYSIKFLLTHRLNQDCLENLFSQIRSRGGMYDHPTPLSALQRIKAIMLGKNPGILQAKHNSGVDACVSEDCYLVAKVFEKADVQAVHQGDLTAVEGEHAVLLEFLGEENPEFQNYSSENVLQECSNYVGKNLQLSETGKDGMCYIAGWIAKKHPNIPNLGSSTEETVHEHFYSAPSWVQQLSYGGLIQPTEDWLTTVEEMDKHFISFHGSTYLRKGKNCTRHLVNKLSETYPSVDKKCIICFVRIRTFIRLNHLNQQLKKKHVGRSNNKIKSTDLGNKVSKKMKKILT